MTDTTATPSEFVYKILRHEEAEVLERFGRFAGSPDDERDGFVHLSLAHQVGRTLKRYFSGADVIVLKVDARKLADLRYEASSRSALYPHLYGSAIVPSMIVNRQEVMFDEEAGEHAYEQPAPEKLTLVPDGPYAALLTKGEEFDSTNTAYSMLKGTGNMQLTVPGDPNLAATLEETRQQMRDQRSTQTTN